MTARNSPVFKSDVISPHILSVRRQLIFDDASEPNPAIKRSSSSHLDHKSLIYCSTMVLFILYLKAELDGVASIKQVKDAPLCISVKNPLSDYEVREKVVVDRSEFVEQAEGAREPPHHFQLKWEGSKKQSTLAIVDDAVIKTALKKKKKVEAPRDYTADDSGEWVPIVAVECKGLEPTAFFAMGNDFVVTSTGGVEFSDDVDIGEGDWGEYDEDNDAAVSLTDIEFKWESI
jgi:hypothetical protein